MIFADFRSFSVTLAGKRWRARLLPRRMPPWWMPLAPKGQALRGRRLRTWPYVLQALRLPYILYRGWEPMLCVPVFLYKISARNLYEFDEEEANPKKREYVPDDLPCAWLAFFFILPILAMYGLRVWPPMQNMAAFLGFPDDPSRWPALLGADNVRMRLFNEWSRTGTALFLHSDLPHLVANCAFTLIFARLLAGRTGAGLAFFLTIWSGAFGNLAAALARTGFVLSIGFSTALFGCVGALSGYVSVCSRPRAMLPLAAGAAILALLGTEGENTDYLAHVCGLLCGMATGWLSAHAVLRKPELTGLRWQLIFFFAGAVLPPVCFMLRLGVL